MRFQYCGNGYGAVMLLRYGAAVQVEFGIDQFIFEAGDKRWHGLDHSQPEGQTEDFNGCSRYFPLIPMMLHIQTPSIPYVKKTALMFLAVVLSHTYILVFSAIHPDSPRILPVHIGNYHFFQAEALSFQTLLNQNDHI